MISRKIGVVGKATQLGWESDTQSQRALPREFRLLLPQMEPKKRQTTKAKVQLRI
jgi:hypothetical protein